jgi:hypothetical protein
MEYKTKVFVNKGVSGEKCVAILLKGAAIVEDDNGDLVPLLGLTPQDTRMMAHELVACADEIDGDK